MAVRHRWNVRMGGLAVLVSVFAMAHAAAQVLSTLFPEGVPGYGAEPGVTVLSRVRTGLEPEGVPLGVLRLFPRMETSFGYDDNVMGGNPRRGSWAVATRPSALVTGDWSTHGFGAYVGLSDTRYLSQSSQNRTDATLSVGGTVDIARDKLTLSASHIVTHQDRTQIDALPSDKPVPVRIDEVRASFEVNQGRWTWTPNIQASRWVFGDTTTQGVPTSQSYRNRDVLRGGVTLRYELAPLRNLVFVARGVHQRYWQPSPGQPRSDSSGFQMLIGFDYDDDAVWRYRLLVGGEARYFSNPAYRSHSGLVAEGEVTWSPNGMTTVRATLLREFEDAAQEGNAGYVYTLAKLSVNHELMREITLTASAGFQHASYLQGGSQWGYAFGAGVTWLVNRNMRLSATYDASGIRGTNLGVGPVSGDYGRNIALLTLRLGL